MPDEEKDVEETEEEAPKKKSPLPMIIAIAVVGIALAGGISFFVASQMMGSGGGGGGEEYGDIRNHNPGTFIKLGDAKEGIIVNVGGGRSSKFLKASIVLEMNPNKVDIINPETHALTDVANTKILDTTMQFLRASKVEDLDATKQDELKKRLVDLLNSELGSGSVYDIYITSFLLQ